MSGTPDQIFRDDDAYLLRQMDKRIASLERTVKDLSPVGSISMFGGPLRSSVWSENRDTSIGSNFTRRWKLNDVNQTKTMAEVSNNAAWSFPLHSTQYQGKIGGLASEGSYSVYHDNNTNLATLTQAVATGQRGWSMEAIFSPASASQNQRLIFFNGSGSNGYGMYMGGAAGGSGSLLVFWGQNMGWKSTGVTLVSKRWYHCVAVADATLNTIRWYLGELDPVTRQFSYYEGSIALPTPPIAPTTNMFFGQLHGWVDEICVFNGEIPGGTARKSAEDRIRAALQPAPPSGWVACDGAAVSRTKYGRLFRVIGTYNGAGDGLTTFNLPNFPGGIIKL